MVDLFADIFEFDTHDAEVPDRPEWAKRDKLAFEREMLGLYVSDHPLAGLETQLAKLSSSSVLDVLNAEATELRDGDTVTIAGLVTDVSRRVAKASGKTYAAVQLEDFTGDITVMFLGRTYQDFGDQLMADSVVTVRGRVSRRDDGVNIHANSVTFPKLEVMSESQGPLVLSIPENRASATVIGSLNDVLAAHPGDTEVQLRLTNARSARVFELPRRVRVTADLYGELKSLLGPRCLI